MTRLHRRRWALALTLLVLGGGWAGTTAAWARPNPGGLGGPRSGLGVRPGVGVGAPGAGLYRGAGAPGVGAWGRGGYWGARTWNTGWYRVAPTGWGWWGPSAAAWGISSLATAAAVTSLVNASAEQQSTLIVVPQTNIQLDYSSVQGIAPSSATFRYAVTGGPYQMGQVECKQGLLNGFAPTTADQAQLLNAVCQVAYGAA